jgi:zinc protease
MIGKHMLKWIRLLLACFSMFLTPLVFANPVFEYTLPNGLKLLVKEDHRAPVVISQIWYKVGSSYEPGGITGISHALEHMMFKGTQKYPPGAFVHIIAANGGEENAETSDDYTFYYQELASDKLNLSFQLEADRMRNLLLSPQEFAKEIQVVISERHMRTDDIPDSLTYERFAAAAHISSPYHQPVIGWIDDLNHMTAQDLRQWYQNWYAPNNATIVVVGDVKPQAVLALATTYFGTIATSSIPALKPQQEIPPLGTRRLTVKTPAQLPWIVMGYNVPSLKTAKEPWHAYALEVLAGILDGGSSARLSKDILRGTQSATDANAGYALYSRLDTLFTLDATPATGHTLSELETALLKQVQQLQTQLVSNEELARVKAQVVANKIYQKDSIVQQATELGMLVSVGLPWQTSDDYVKQIQAITPAQLQTVAKLYLTPERLTVGILEPQPEGTKMKASANPPIGALNVR